MPVLRQVWTVIADAVGHFDADDGWAMASHVAMTSLLALFPFLIFSAAVASVVASADLAEQAAILLLSAWPKEVAEPIVAEIHAVLTRPRQDLLTIGFVITLWLASNGVESLRVALNRAYRVRETRSFLFRRAQSLMLVVLGALGAMALATMIVLVPALWQSAVARLPALEPLWSLSAGARYATVTLVLAIALAAAHRMLPVEPPRFSALWPGVVFTLVSWLAAATGFGVYLANFSSYAVTYAGLAGAATTLVFLYLSAVIFILGGELNAAIARNAERPAEAPTG